MNPEAGALGAAAGSVADGAAVDWNGVEADAGPRGRRLIRHLRLVESIASLYRSIPDLEETVADDVPSGPRWGRLVLLNRIGRGSSCDVHRAFDTDLHRYVALKLVQDDGAASAAAHDRMLQEARRLARIRHANVVQVLGAEQHNDRVGLWMELIEGESLEQIVRSRGPFGAREASSLGEDVCSALAAVHAARLVHRDVKAQNVMRENGGRTVLMDFGTGEELRQRAGRAPRLVGTPLYLAPEIFQHQPASIQSDLYSVGVLLFYLVTGEFPVFAATMEQLAAAHVARKVRRLKDVRADLPSPFVAVVERALARDPAARYQSAGEMEAALRDHAVAPRAAPPTEVEPVPFSRRAATIASFATLLAIVVALIAWLSVSPKAPPRPAFTRLAILPFEDLSATPTPYLATALTDQLVATLGQVQSLRVTAPTVANGGTRAAVSSEALAKQLGVDAIVEGSVTVMPAGPNEPVRARLESRILRAGVSTPFWTGTLTWVAGDNQALQAGLVRAIAKAVNVALTAGDAGRMRLLAQANPNAEEAYLRGYAELRVYGPDAARRALDYFTRALSFDAGYAAAHAGASRAYVNLGQFGVISEGEARQSALLAARTALQLNDDLPEAHRAVADLSFFYDWDWATAEREYLKTLELNPSFSRARLSYAGLLAVLHRFPEAVQQLEIASSLDPQSSEIDTSKATILVYAGENERGRALIERTVLDRPDLAAGWVTRANIDTAQGRYDDGLDAIAHASTLARGGVAVEMLRLQLLAFSGRAAEARAGLAALEAQAALGSLRFTHRDRALVRFALGDENGACDEFEKAFEARESMLRWISVDRRLHQLRGNPRFQAILKGMGLP